MTRADIMKLPWSIPEGELDEKRSLGLPVHVYCGVCLVATFYSPDAAQQAVDAHNATVESP